MNTNSRPVKPLLDDNRPATGANIKIILKPMTKEGLLHCFDQLKARMQHKKLIINNILTHAWLTERNNRYNNKIVNLDKSSEYNLNYFLANFGKHVSWPSSSKL